MSIPVKDWPPLNVGETDFRGNDWKNDLQAGETITTYGFDSDDLTVSGLRRDLVKPITFANFNPTVAAGTLSETNAWIDTSTGRHLIVRMKMPIT